MKYEIGAKKFLDQLHNRVTTKLILECTGVGLLLLLFALNLCQGLHHSLWQDEAFTVSQYIDKGVLAIVTGDGYRPNNHMLYNLSLLFPLDFFGFSEALVRAPSIVASVVALGLMYYTVRRFVGQRVAICVLVVCTLGSFHVDALAGARGYGYLFLLSSMVNYFTFRYVELCNNREQDKKRRIFLALAIASGVMAIYTYPSYAVFLLCVFVVIFIKNLPHWKEMLVATTAGLLAIGVLFAPLAKGVVEFYVGFGGGFVNHEALDWTAVFALPVERLNDVFTPYVAPLVSGGMIVRVSVISMISLLFFGVFLYGVLQAWLHVRNVFFIMILPTLIFVAVSVILSIPIGSRDDYTIFLTPIYITVFSMGLVGVTIVLLSYARRLPGVYRVVLGVVAMIAALCMIFYTANQYELMVNARTVPYEDTRKVVALIDNVEQKIQNDCKIISRGSSLREAPFDMYENKAVVWSGELATVGTLAEVDERVSLSQENCLVVLDTRVNDFKSIMSGFDVVDTYRVDQRRTGVVYVTALVRR